MDQSLKNVKHVKFVRYWQLQNSRWKGHDRNLIFRWKGDLLYKTQV